jgi:hypothetical protein
LIAEDRRDDGDDDDGYEALNFLLHCPRRRTRRSVDGGVLGAWEE